MTVDLERVRRTERRLHELVAAHPEVASRTADYLSGGLPGVALESDVTDVPIKLPPELVAMLDELVPEVERFPELAITMGRVSRASVARVALLYGIQRLRADLATAKGPR